MPIQNAMGMALSFQLSQIFADSPGARIPGSRWTREPYFVFSATAGLASSKSRTVRPK
jgi:hypothetical protein